MTMATHVSSLSCLVLLVASAASASTATDLAESRTTLNLSNFEFTTESMILALIVAAVIVADIFFGAVLGNLLFGARRRDGRPQNQFARRAEEVYNSIDVAESTFNTLKLRNEACRHKAVCEMEDVARRRPIARIVTAMFDASSGSERYAEAKRYGYKGYNCAEIYYDCPTSIFPKFKLF